MAQAIGSDPERLRGEREWVRDINPQLLARSPIHVTQERRCHA